jgi:hypothetical protein
MTPEIVGAIVRHILTAVGGYFVSKGVVDHGAVEAIIGGVVAAIGLGWSLIAKLKKA